MDVEEAARIVYSKIQSLDPENASKIMSYLYIQEGKDKELIRLAFSSEPVLLSVINQAKIHCGLSSNSSSTPTTPSSPSPLNPLSNPNRHNPVPLSSPRIIIPNNGFHTNPSSPSSPWSASGFSGFRSPRPLYASLVNGNVNGASGPLPPPIGSSFSLPSYYSRSKINDGNAHARGQFSYLDDSSLRRVDFVNPIMSPGGRSDSVLMPYGGLPKNCGNNHHRLLRRCCSVSDAFIGGDGGSEDAGCGLGWKPCVYCKNGSTCKFVHGDFSDCPADSSSSFVGSPSKFDGFDEMMRIKMLQQQQQRRMAIAAQLMAGGSPRSEAASLMMGEELHKYGRFRQENDDFLAMLRESSNAARQIYLTFPADSTFTEEHVSNYFSEFGPVEDVRIPYQQKRMFGFVTFLYPETVRTILAKGNPHFVCDSRVLVKPYKEKGKIPDKKQQMHQFERGDFSGCASPSGFDPREPFDLPVGPRILSSNQQVMLRRKLEEQAELQQAIEMERRRMLNLQLMNLQNGQHGHQFRPNMGHGFPVSMASPTRAHFNMYGGDVFQHEGFNQENSEGGVNQQKQEAVEPGFNNRSKMNSGMEQHVDREENFINGSLENVFPEELFASPTKRASQRLSSFSALTVEVGDSAALTATSSSDNVTQPATSLDKSSGNHVAVKHQGDGGETGEQHGMC